MLITEQNNSNQVLLLTDPIGFLRRFKSSLFAEILCSTCFLKVFVFKISNGIMTLATFSIFHPLVSIQWTHVLNMDWNLIFIAVLCWKLCLFGVGTTSFKKTSIFGLFPIFEVFFPLLSGQNSYYWRSVRMHIGSMM